MLQFYEKNEKKKVDKEIRVKEKFEKDKVKYKEMYHVSKVVAMN